MTSRCVRFWFLTLVLTAGAASAQSTTSDLPFTFQKDVLIPARDGVGLAAHIFLPKQGGPFPVILQRTPYGKPDDKSGEIKHYCAAGYAVVAQDCRGRGRSQGQWEPFRYDADDGFETQEWIGHQSWCNGHIGTYGGSYVGWTQWSAASRGSRYLTCMVPVVPFADAYHDIAYLGGAFQLSLCFGWGAGVGGLKIEPAKMATAYSFLPLNTWDEQGDKRVFFLRDWIAHPTFDDYWRRRGIDEHFERVTVPALNIGGWYDIFSKPAFEHIAKVRRSSTNLLARRNQFVVMGPWGHGVGGQKLGEVDFGPSAKVDLGKVQFDWFEYWLRGQNTGVQDWPSYRIFVMGENVWRNESEWPPARTQFTPWYLHGGGKATTRSGDGSLSSSAPEEEPADRFTYDPANPAPTKGGNNLVGTLIGPFDQSTVEERTDVLVYTSAALEKAVEVTGPVKVVLHAASSALDTDFTAKLVDVFPDGKAYNLCDGILRARYRESMTKTALIEPGRTYRFEIDLWVTSNLFQPGHRVRLEISSSNFPRFDRNPNTGHDFGVDAAMVKADQTVFHDRVRPSHVLLPICPRLPPP